MEMVVASLLDYVISILGSNSLTTADLMQTCMCIEPTRHTSSDLDRHAFSLAARSDLLKGSEKVVWESLAGRL